MPHLKGIQDATIRHLEQGRTQCFVHIVTDDGLEGLGTGGGAQAAREIIEGSLKPILMGQDPLNIEQLWDDMFWRIRGVGRKGTVEESDRITYTEFSEPVNGVWSPNPDKPGLGLELDPEAVKQYAV